MGHTDILCTEKHYHRNRKDKERKEKQKAEVQSETEVKDDAVFSEIEQDFGVKEWEGEI